MGGDLKFSIVDWREGVEKSHETWRKDDWCKTEVNWWHVCQWHAGHWMERARNPVYLTNLKISRTWMNSFLNTRLDFYLYNWKCAECQWQGSTTSEQFFFSLLKGQAQWPRWVDDKLLFWCTFAYFFIQRWGGCFCFVLFFGEGMGSNISCGSGWLWTHCIAEAGLTILILMPSPPGILERNLNNRKKVNG